MKQLWSTLLTFLFAHSSLARWFSHVLDCLSLFEDVLANPDEMLLCRSPEGRRRIEAYIVRCEDWIQFLIAARAAELAGLNLTYAEAKRCEFWTPHTPRDWASLMQRYQRMRLSFRNIERMARRRAARLKREIAVCPLRLAATPQSTPPALRAEEDSAILLEVLPRRRRGRWIGASSRRDGGGCASSRGPPPTSLTGFKNTRLASTCEVAPACAQRCPCNLTRRKTFLPRPQTTEEARVCPAIRKSTTPPLTPFTMRSSATSAMIPMAS